MIHEQTSLEQLHNLLIYAQNDGKVDDQLTGHGISERRQHNHHWQKNVHLYTIYERVDVGPQSTRMTALITIFPVNIQICSWLFLAL